ncbi:nucleotide pyrophosphohydrolase [Neoactinobaculum massilliense]|uniref:nucleotide pyrophosphohydrolase n=1 Tax=Neoactinobaculum massilliense TaxID=2364794 RepID=UPI000F52A2DE|nr:nucleotide pyrophosphohydrolase [Neoactinobaculum massilliense]
MSFDDVMHDLNDFYDEREWDQFHSEANLAKSISIEAGELLECFQWSDTFDAHEVIEELADVLTYAYTLAAKLKVDPEAIIREKLEVTRKKYPVEKARGTATKYTKL